MELYQNKKSGKYFIAIENHEYRDEMLLVGPDCSVKVLKIDLFCEDSYEGEPNELLKKGFISDEQLEKYFKVHDMHFENFMELFDEYNKWAEINEVDEIHLDFTKFTRDEFINEQKFQLDSVREYLEEFKKEQLLKR